MVVSHKDWELPNSLIGMAEIDILLKRSRFSHLHRQCSAVKTLHAKIIEYFHLAIFIFGSAKKPDGKKRKEDEKTLAVFSSSPFASKMSVSTNQLP